jgi:hypothetical protein
MVDGDIDLVALRPAEAEEEEATAPAAPEEEATA